MLFSVFYHVVDTICVTEFLFNNFGAFLYVIIMSIWYTVSVCEGVCLYNIIF